MSRPEVTNLDDWYKTLDQEHSPLPNETALTERLKGLARGRWGEKKDGNISFEIAVEDGYLLEDGTLTEKGRELLLASDANQRAKNKATAQERMIVKKREGKSVSSEKPQDMIEAIFHSHGLPISREFFSVEIDDRMINSATKNYRLTFYSKGTKAIVGVFRGTLDQLRGIIDDQALLVSESIYGMPDRRKKDAGTVLKEESEFSQID